MKKSLKTVLTGLATFAFVGATLAACSGGGTAATAEPVIEEIQIEKDNYKIPGVLTMPAGKKGEKVPAVVMLHGTGSNKDEVANQYVELAKELAEANIASLRIDFAGTGDSERDYSEYTITGAVDDAQQAFDFLSGHDGIDPERIGVMGYSQGGLIATEFASSNDKVKGLVTWAGTTSMVSYVEEHKDVYEAAKASKDGYAEMDLGFIKLNFSNAWFEEALKVNGLDNIKNYKAPFLAINGSIDDVVIPETAQKLVEASGSEDAEYLIIKDADHLYRAFDEQPHPATKEVRDATVSWFSRKL